MPTSNLTFATKMAKREGKNSLSREHKTSTKMNQVDTSPLRDRGTAGWTFVGLVVVDELVRFRILQLLHTPCTSCCMSPLHPCSHLSDPVVLVHPWSFVSASFSSRRTVGVVLFCDLVVRHFYVLIPSNVGQRSR